MQGTELLRDPSFAQTLEQSPFQANDLPGLSTAVADTFEKLSPDQRKELKAVLDELDDLSREISLIMQHRPEARRKPKAEPAPVPKPNRREE